MNPKSASRTLASHKPNRRAVYGIGIRRVFNYRMPEKAFNYYGSPVSEKHVAALNIITTGNEDDRVNGILQFVELNDIPNFRGREVGYQLTPVEVFDWTTGKRIEEPVYVLELADPDSSILPHLYYLEVCLEGAASISESFKNEFSANTYLADLRTNLDHWK